MFRPLLISLYLICSAVSAKIPVVYEDFKLHAIDGVDGDSFGFSVASSGDTVIVGAYFDDDNGSASGSAYIYRFEDSSWNFETKLTASDGASSDWFGFSVAISGDTVIVGAYADDDNGTTSGSAYIYRFEDSSWNFETKLTAYDGASVDKFGYSVSISGDVVVVGAPGDDDNGTSSGSAYVYRLKRSSWNFETKLTAYDGASDVLFGNRVAISGDTIVVGAHGDDANGFRSGSAYIYRFVKGDWQETKLLASNGVSYDYFGRSVAISGNTLVIGKGGNTYPPSAYVYQFEDKNWNETIVPAGEGAIDFGRSVAISGNTMVVGAPFHDDNGTASGSAYIYELDKKGVWEETKLLASDGASDDHFGWSVSISSDGSTALVGAFNDYDNGNNSGSAYIFDIDVPDGPDCPDINGDGIVDVGDLLTVIDQWGLTNSPADVNQDGIVDVSDLLIVVGNWGPCE